MLLQRVNGHLGPVWALWGLILYLGWCIAMVQLNKN